MSYLIQGGKPALRSGKLVVGADFNCCCDGIACCEGPLACERSEGIFTPGIRCGGDLKRIEIDWVWSLNFDGSCRFFWQIIHLDLFQSGVAAAVDYQNAKCSDPVGVWTPGAQFQPFEFEYTNRPNANESCSWQNATVTIAQIPNGYSFWVSGVEENGGFFCGDCADTDGTFLVECP